MRRRALVCGCVAALLLGACGKDDPEAAKPGASATAELDAGDESVQGLEPQPRPPGLADQVGVRVGAGPEGVSCPSSEKPAVTLALGAEEGEVSIGRAVALCFSGFDVTAPLGLVVTDPDGSTSERVLGSEYVESPAVSEGPEDEGGQTFQLLLPVLPGTAPGEYRYDVSQGRRRAGAEYTVVDQTVPSLWVVPAVDSDYGLFFHPDITPGEAIQVVLTGLPVGDELPLHLYGRRIDDPQREEGYITSFDITADEDGNTSLRIPTTEQDRGLSLCPVFERDVLEDVFRFEPEDPELTEYLWCRGAWFSVGEGRTEPTGG
jgi:hypothetical protein